MTAAFLKWLRERIAAGDAHAFYCTGEWKRKRDDVFKIDKNECQLCKARGKYRRAELVHHVNHLRARPDLALDIYYVDNDGARQRQLLSVCKKCHEVECHPERLHKFKTKSNGYSNTERWD